VLLTLKKMQTRRTKA